VYCTYWICIPTFYLTFFPAYDILAGILFGICSDILSGRYADILSGIYSDIVSGILSGIYSNIPSDSTEIWRQFRPVTEIWTWRWSGSVLQLAVEDLEDEKEDGML